MTDKLIRNRKRTQVCALATSFMEKPMALRFLHGQTLLTFPRHLQTVRLANTSRTTHITEFTVSEPSTSATQSKDLRGVGRESQPGMSFNNASTSSPSTIYLVLAYQMNSTKWEHVFLWLDWLQYYNTIFLFYFIVLYREIHSSAMH